MTLLRKWLLKWLRHKLELNQVERLMIKVGFARFYFARKNGVIMDDLFC